MASNFRLNEELRESIWQEYPEPLETDALKLLVLTGHCRTQGPLSTLFCIQGHKRFGILTPKMRFITMQRFQLCLLVDFSLYHQAISLAKILQKKVLSVQVSTVIRSTKFIFSYLAVISSVIEVKVAFRIKF